MFFVFGSPRSGTTILAQCLSAHSQILVPHETDFLVPTAFVVRRIPDPDTGRRLVADLLTEARSFRHNIGEFLTPERAREAVLHAEYDLASMTEAVFDAVAVATGRPVTGNTSPQDLNSVRLLAEAGLLANPSSRILHVLRDPRDVLASLLELGWVRDGDINFPAGWAARNTFLNTFAKDARRYLLVRYEDFVVEPRGTLDRVCAFLGVEPEMQMLDPSRRHGRYRNYANHPRIYEPVGAARVGRWRRNLGSGLAGHVENYAGDAMQLFGYV